MFGLSLSQHFYCFYFLILTFLHELDLNDFDKLIKIENHEFRLFFELYLKVYRYIELISCGFIKLTLLEIGVY
jgi:hypothetical protein